jgi:hypothetical protein
MKRDDLEDIIAWATPRARMAQGQLVNRAELIAAVMRQFSVPRHAAANAIGHLTLRLRNPRR